MHENMIQLVIYILNQIIWITEYKFSFAKTVLESCKEYKRKLSTERKALVSLFLMLFSFCRMLIFFSNYY